MYRAAAGGGCCSKPASAIEALGAHEKEGGAGSATTSIASGWEPAIVIPLSPAKAMMNTFVEFTWMLRVRLI